MSTTTAKQPEVGHCRPFSLGDAMVFVAAAAVGLWLSSAFLATLWANLRSLPFATISGWSAWWVFFTKTHWGLTASLIFIANDAALVWLCVSTLAYLVARLRKPRPPLARVALQPGMVACEAQAVMFGLSAVVEVVQPREMIWIMFAVLFPLPAAWGLLAVSGRWRREPGWIDRLGVSVGVGWCLELMVYLALYITFMR